MNESEKSIIEYLDSIGTKYIIFEHPVTDTLPEKIENDRKAGIENAMHCKNLFLCNRALTRFYLLTMPFGKVFRTGPDSRKMGSGRLNFATPELLGEFLHTVPGMVSPLELIFDKEKKISFFIDEDILSAERICFHPANDRKTCVFEREDFFEGFLKKSGIGYSVISKNSEEDRK